MLRDILVENHHLKITIIVLASIGAWPLNLQDKPKIQKLYNVFSYTMLIYYALSVVRLFIEMHHLIAIRNIDLLMKNIALAVLLTISLIRALICKTQNILKVIQEIEEAEFKILNCDESAVRNIYMECAKYSQFISKVTLVLGKITLLVLYIIPLTEEPQKQVDISRNLTKKFIRGLPLPIWTPLDSYSHYVAVYFIQIIDAWIAENFIVYNDMLLYSLIIYPVGQMKILQYILKNFSYFVDKEVKLSNIHRNEAGFAVARACIIFHKNIISYLERFDQSVRNVMLLDFISCSLQMSVVLFRIIMTDEISTSMISDCEFLVSMVVQMFLFYWHANEIIVESVRISEAALHNTWYNESEKVKKILLLLSLRAQKPLTVSIGPFYPMSTDTSISILKTTYSYGMLLRQSYQRKVN